MATAGTIIARSLRLIGVIDPEEGPTTTEYANGLISLNAMIDSWQNERLMCYAMRDESISVSSGNTTKTIGPTGDLVSTRPVQIEAAYVVISNISYPVTLLDEEQYAAIAQKTVPAPWPDRIWYQPTMPNGTIYLYPQPSGSSTLHVITRTPLTAFVTTSDAVSLPPGWEEALATNLAIAEAPEYEVQASPTVMKMATDSKANIKRANSRPIRATTDVALMVGHRRSNIITDQP